MSAPSSRTRATLAALPARPTTVAPIPAAAWTKRVPRPPAAAVTTTTSSGAIAAWSRTAIAVRPVPMRATAPSASRPSGICPQRALGDHRLLGVPATRHPQMGDDVAAEPRLRRRRRPVGRSHRPPPGQASSATREAGTARPIRRGGSSCRAGGRRPTGRRSAPRRRAGGGRAPPRCAGPPADRTRADGWRACADRTSSSALEAAPPPECFVPSECPVRDVCARGTRIHANTRMGGDWVRSAG